MFETAAAICVHNLDKFKNSNNSKGKVWVELVSPFEIDKTTLFLVKTWLNDGSIETRNNRCRLLQIIYMCSRSDCDHSTTGLVSIGSSFHERIHCKMMRIQWRIQLFFCTDSSETKIYWFLKIFKHIWQNLELDCS